MNHCASAADALAEDLRLPTEELLEFDDYPAVVFHQKPPSAHAELVEACPELCRRV